jgi:hypothetical protein
MDLIPSEPVPEGSSRDVSDANAKRMTFTKQQAFRDMAPESGSYFNEVCIYSTAECLDADEI